MFAKLSLEKFSQNVQSKIFQINCKIKIFINFALENFHKNFNWKNFLETFLQNIQLEILPKVLIEIFPELIKNFH